MHRKRLLVLALVVGGLAWAVSRRAGDAPDPADVSGRVPLFPELVAARVDAIRVDSLERGHVVRMVREPDGWRLVEPVEYPARDAYARKLVELATESAAVEPDLSPAEAGLDPPRIVVDYTEALTGGGERTHRIELGRIDVDGASVYARVDGRLLRAPRAFDSAAERPAKEFRDRRAVVFDPRKVTEIVRAGSLIVAGPDPEAVGPADPSVELVERDLGFSAVLDGPRWLEVEPARTRLSAGAVRVFLGHVLALEARRFPADGTDDLQPFGLDPPMWRVEVGLADGSRAAVRLGCGGDQLAQAPATRRWFAQAEGRPFVLEVAPEAALRLARDLAWLRDPRLVDVREEGVAAIVLERGGESLRLARAGEDGWAAGVDGGEAQPAEPGLALDVLGALREAELAPLVPADELPTDFEEAGALALELVDGSDDRVALGAVATVGGATGRLARRRGDALVGVLAEDPLAVLGRPLEHWLARRVLDLDELRLRGVVVTLPSGASVEWTRDPSTGLWSRGDGAGEDLLFAPLVDRLLGLGALAWLPAEAAGGAELADRLRVVVRDRDGDEVELRFGRDPGGDRTLVEVGGRVAEVGPSLPDALRRAAGG